MTIGINLRSITDEIGTYQFFNAFFFTVSGNLEPNGWGTRFPLLMNKLYAGELCQFDAGNALIELDNVVRELVAYPVESIIWDIEDRQLLPPWGDNIASSITNLSNYFVTSTGRDLAATIREILEDLHDNGGVLKLVSL